jgi:hypothetical protein
MNVKKKTILKATMLLLPAIGIMVSVSQINNIQKYISFASDVPANISVDVRQSAGVPSRPWTNIAQGGESIDFSLKPFGEELNHLQPNYVRIDHLFDFYIKITKDENGTLVYDFSKLDSLIKEMQEVNISPFISLSYMPDVLNSDITGVPNNWSLYQQIIQRTIEHISGTNGLSFSNVYYEVWNEPDLFGSWKTYGDKNYLNLYTHAAQAAGAASNVKSFKFGGPGTTKLYSNWIKSLLKIVTSQNLRLDFISWHHYTTNPEDFKKDTDDLIEMVTDYKDKARTLEIIISEWGPNSENDPIYDNSISAAHMVTSTIEMMPIIDKAFIFELEDGKNAENKEYWGRWGLYTHNSFGIHPKPRAEAIKLLNLLGTDRIKLAGNGSKVKALAARKNNTIQIIIANYDLKDKHNENVPLSIEGLTPGNYTFTKTFLSRSTYTQSINILTSTYQTSIPLAPNSVVLLELTPIQ